MDKRKPLPWWEEYLGFSLERFKRRTTWRTGFAYFGYSTAIPLVLAANPMIGPVRPVEVAPHVPVQSQGTTIIGSHIPVVTDTGGSPSFSVQLTGAVMQTEQGDITTPKRRSWVVYDSPSLIPWL
jgi:hypothetical protein